MIIWMVLPPNDLHRGQWAGVDSAWEQEKLEATLREMLENATEFPASSPRFVGLILQGNP